jgi:hypothetical protein
MPKRNAERDALDSIVRDAGRERMGERAPKDRRAPDLMIMISPQHRLPSDEELEAEALEDGEDASLYGEATDKDPVLPGSGSLERKRRREGR